MRLVADDTWAVLTIFQEASGESYGGKVAVAEVIWRRTQERFFSDGTIPGTVLRPYQFSGWNTTDPNRLRAARLDDSLPVVRDCLTAWEEAKAGSNITRGALLYYNPKVVNQVPVWATSAAKVAEVGEHLFFRPT